VRRALIASLSPATGGVSAMQRAALALLAERGYESTVAWYEPYSWAPRLSVPLYRLGTRRVGSEARPVPGARAGHAIGAWLPELEFTQYWPTARWRELIAAHDLHLVVSGNCLAGLAFARTGTPFLAWVASDWNGDRKDRVARYPVGRRLLDRLVVRPAVRRLEPQILRRGRVVALSEPTRRALDRVAGRPVVRAVMPCPIDVERFRPAAAAVVPGRVGFVGRFDDPRKNLPFFLDALQAARRESDAIHAVVVGGEPSPALRAEVAARGLVGTLEFAGRVDPARYAEILSTLDLLAVTSHQEGLHIAALEAMACGCPVVSTRCGGPEEFVVDGVNGFLVSSPEELGERALAIRRERDRRHRLGEAARLAVVDRYGWDRVRAIFSSLGLEELAAER
jgi:glycosyltransferase involved in cell wall biosynthesis